MQHSMRWTNSTTATGTPSGRLQPNNYRIPLAETHAGTPEHAPLSRLVVGTCHGYAFFAPMNEADECPAKRIAACLIALAMPREGVDEHLQSTADQLKYWTEMASLTPVESAIPGR